VASVRQHADALLAAGCYRCLEEALTIYDNIATTSSRDAATASERAFDSTVLLAIRDRELGMRTQDHQPAVQSRLSSHPRRRAVLFAAVLDQVPWHVYASSGAEHDAMLVRRPGRGESVAVLRTELSSLPASDLPAQYLRQTIDCLSADEVPTDSAAPAPVPLLPLLMRYRAATCGTPDVDALAQLAQADARFIEVDLPIGDAALNGGALLSAERHHAAALQGFPDMLRGHAARTRARNARGVRP